MSGKALSGDGIGKLTKRTPYLPIVLKIVVTHSTVYRYDFPVYLEPHIFRLRPRTNSAQRLLGFDLQIVPMPAGTTECLDQDGQSCPERSV
jgi:Bacterial transglutaminase-like N-terminal region